jgi:hypothetical protein
MYKIDNFNKDLITERYVDDIVNKLHFIEVKERLKDCLLQQKCKLSNEDLELEIMRHDPELLTDIYLEETLEGV